MSRAVRFDRYGDSGVLELVEVEDRAPGPGEVTVAVAAAGLNPGEIGIREGALDDVLPARFPEGQGSDFAGTIAAVGEGVERFSRGDAVIGMSDERNAQAERVTLPADDVVPKPRRLGWEEAAALYVAGTTAWACVQAVRPRPHETVVVAGAAGGVGVLATQLAVRSGATVIATARRDHHAYLAGLGARPVEYGDGMADRIREIASPVAAYIDTHGEGNVEAARALAVPPHRVNTTIEFAAAEEYGAQTLGQAAVPEPAAVVEDLAKLIADGALELPIRRRYPLDKVREAYDELAEGHGLGKIVLYVGAE